MAASKKAQKTKKPKAPKPTPASKRIIVHLDNQDIAFEVVKHRKVYTAYDLAQTSGVPLEQVAKTLLVRIEVAGTPKKEEKFFAVVLPASHSVDLGKLKKTLGAKKIELVFEKGMAKLGIEPGALTPFGSLRGFGTVVDNSLIKTKSALVGAESFIEHVRLNMKDFVKSENPVVGSFGKKNTLKIQAKPKSKPKKRPSKGKAHAQKRAAMKKKSAAKKSKGKSKGKK